jgi:hypothetical protein
MGFARTILAAVIAASLALLPVGGSAVAAASANKMAVTDMSSDGGMPAGMDCCPDETTPCNKTPDQCPFMASCLQVVSLLAVDLAKLAVPSPRAGKASMPADHARHFPGIGPPLPPPRV